MRVQNLINLPISLSSFLLISIGILVIYSSSKELALQQFIFTIAGFILFFFISTMDLQSIKNLIKPAYIFILILLIVTFLIGFETRGSIRWIPLGFFNIQPSEFAKPIIILFLAKFWSRHLPSWVNILKSLAYLFPVLFLVFKQPDLGTMLTIFAIWLGMLMVSHISFKKILVLGFILLSFIPASWFLLHGYQQDRIYSFLAPESDPLGRGYNIIQSKVAVGSGQLFGRGLGRGTQSRLQFLPEFRTDFIFASTAEELGFVGTMLILSLYLFLLLYSLQKAQQVTDLFSLMIIIGVVSMFVFQVFVNIGMNVGLLPITGITLPLISYGGSSLIVTWLSLGLLVSALRLGTAR